MNKIDDTFPWTKIAILKRAYRRKPTDARNVWCSNPEAVWTSVSDNMLQSVEHVLLYMHETDVIQKNIEKWFPENDPKPDKHKRTEFYGSPDIAVADSVMTTIIKHKTKPTREQVRLAMLEVVSKFIKRMQFNKAALPPAPLDFIDWIDALMPGYFIVAYYTALDYVLFMSIFLLMSSLLKLAKSWFKLAELEKENKSYALKSLQSKVNPHFFFLTILFGRRGSFDFLNSAFV